MAEAPLKPRYNGKTRPNPTYAHTQGVTRRSRTSRFVLSMLSVGELMLCFFFGNTDIVQIKPGSE